MNSPKILQKKITLILISLIIAFITIFSQKHLEAKPVQPATQQIASTWKKAFFPVENFQGYSSLFGNRISPYNGKVEFHNGLDIAAPLGSYVHNWWSGEIVKVSDGDACGTSVIIQSGQWKHIYCHMMGHVENTSAGRYLIDRDGGIQLMEGQRVSTGARIGRIGMTGRTTGPHLHWGLMYNGKYFDPGTILTQMYQ